MKISFKSKRKIKLIIRYHLNGETKGFPLHDTLSY